MSNEERDPRVQVLEPGEPCRDVEVLLPRAVPLGGPRAMPVSRTLPQKRRSLVGAWCFLDHYGPDDVSETGGMLVPRHPHTGLATVSWLFSGEVEHLDSGGNAARIVPGELNLMVAGRGITHQEISTPATTLHGVQLWYALPDATRFGDNAFAHYAPESVSPAPGVAARVFIGALAGSVSPVETRTPDLLGAELTLEAGARVALDVRSDFELAVLAETGGVRVNGTHVAHRALAYVPVGSDALVIEAGDAPARIILLGGVPLGEQIVMWWNFVGRSHDEIVDFRRRYQAELGFENGDAEDPLFGSFPAGQPDPLPAPALPNARLRPRA
ncbi:pirin family protein [Microbacterium karelineae]|uniref:pirin family protein n=1 Tax=Microbacterium karelineae TaxID=2654283 RepID=UPI0012E9969B|nr:pirin family protein [Microbacterium karelineae]